MKNHAYSYLPLRYVYDVSVQEFLNLGVVVFSPKSKFVGARFTSSFERIRKVFPAANLQDLRETLNYMKSRFESLNGNLPDGLNHARDVALLVLPHDDGSLQWGNIIGGGMTDDLGQALDKIFARMVPGGADGWIPVADRAPVLSDGDDFGEILWCGSTVVCRVPVRTVLDWDLNSKQNAKGYWRPTGFERPAPPAGILS